LIHGIEHKHTLLKKRINKSQEEHALAQDGEGFDERTPICLEILESGPDGRLIGLCNTLPLEAGTIRGMLLAVLTIGIP
jgi:hypothetical protein